MSEVSVGLARWGELDRIGEIVLDAYVADDLLDEDRVYEAVLRDSAGRFEHAELLVAVDDDETVLGSITIARHGTAYAQVAHEGEL